MVHEDTAGVTSQALSNSTTDLEPQDSVSYLPKITATRLQTKLAYVGFDNCVDQTDDDRIEQTHDTSKPRVTPVYPNRLEIKYVGAPVHLKDQYETVFRLTIGCRADVWFTEDADQNRLHLKRFFEQLRATLDPVLLSSPLTITWMLPCLSSCRRRRALSIGAIDPLLGVKADAIAASNCASYVHSSVHLVCEWDQERDHHDAYEQNRGNPEQGNAIRRIVSFDSRDEFVVQQP